MTKPIDLVDDVKQRARVLNKRARHGDAAALTRLRALPELGQHPDSALAELVQRRHCLAVLAQTLGFAGWPHAKAVLSGDRVVDLGTLLYRESGGSLLNIWSASYQEAHQIRRDHGGYLVPYRHHFLIVEEHFIAALGLDPNDPDWDRIGRDWPRPADRAAWSRITHAAIEARLKNAA